MTSWTPRLARRLAPALFPLLASLAPCSGAMADEPSSRASAAPADALLVALGPDAPERVRARLSAGLAYASVAKKPQAQPNATAPTPLALDPLAFKPARASASPSSARSFDMSSLARPTLARDPASDKAAPVGLAGLGAIDAASASDGPLARGELAQRWDNFGLALQVARQQRPPEMGPSPQRLSVQLMGRLAF